jgi:hypothetical protein
MDHVQECDRLSQRFAQKRAEGLVDVKFFVRNHDEATVESVCREVNRLYDAVELGEAEDLDFKDSHR